MREGISHIAAINPPTYLEGVPVELQRVLHVADVVHGKKHRHAYNRWTDKGGGGKAKMRMNEGRKKEG